LTKSGARKTLAPATETPFANSSFLSVLRMLSNISAVSAPDEGAAALIEGLRRGDRRALARAITYAESTLPEHAQLASRVLDAVLPSAAQSLRLAISGVPGAGKSTLIEALGQHLITQGRRPAVLAVDPSSPISGGAILGDKTRMERLATKAEAFVRPSPSAGRVGGIAPHTREAILLCEAAGFDVVIVETVGTGQSEIAAAQITDIFVLLQIPGAGDELQAMKKGVLELADILVVNKADVDARAAEHTARDLSRSRRLQSPASTARRSSPSGDR